MSLPAKACARPSCTNHLKGKQVKFCSGSCRQQDYHDKKRQLAESVALAEVRAQVQPVVREALTDRVLLEIKVLTELLPTAVGALAKNLESDDEGERRQAAALILKYTVGNSSVAPAGEEAQAPDINIQFGLPVQGDRVDPAAGSVLGAAEDDAPPPERECMECHEFKPGDEFVGNSDRCEACHAQMLADIDQRFPGMLSSGA